MQATLGWAVLQLLAWLLLYLLAERAVQAGAVSGGLRFSRLHLRWPPLLLQRLCLLQAGPRGTSFG